MLLSSHLIFAECLVTFDGPTLAKEKVQEVSTLYDKSCIAGSDDAKIRSFEAFNSCVKGAWDGIYTDNKEALVALGTIAYENSPLGKGVEYLWDHTKNTYSTILSSETSFSEKCIAGMSFVSPIVALASMGEDAQEKAKRGAILAYKKLSGLYLALESADLTQINKEIQALTASITNEKVKESALVLFNQMAKFATDPELEDVRSNLTCNIISGVGLDVLIAYVTVGVGGSKAIAGLLLKLKKVEKVLLVADAIAQMKKFGNLDLVIGKAKPGVNANSKEAMNVIFQCAVRS